MGRSTAAEVAQRIDAVYDLLLQGAGRRAIAQYAAGRGWPVSSRQLDTYIARARRLLAKAADHDRDYELGRAKERLDLLFMKAIGEDELAEARAVLRDMTDLLGLAVQRHEISGPGGGPLLSQDDLAAQFRALVETKAERLGDDDAKEA